MKRTKTYISIDIEAALIRGKQYIIEIGAVKWKPDGSTETYTQLIQPYRFTRLNSRIQQLTGITTEQLLDAPAFKQAIQQFKRWCGEDYILLTFGEFDRKVLEEELARNYVKPYFLYPMIDFQQKYMIHHGMKEQPSLGGLMEQLELELETQHRALADADSLLRIFQKVDGEAMIETQKTNEFSLLLGSLKQHETDFSCILTVVEGIIEPTRIEIHSVQSHTNRLPYTYETVTKLNAEGEEESSQVIRIQASDVTKDYLEAYFNGLSSEVLVTRSGLKGLSRLMRLHSISAPKIEVMTLTNIFKTEEIAEMFRYDGEIAEVYEKKVTRLLKQYKNALISEFKKRALIDSDGRF